MLCNNCVFYGSCKNMIHSKECVNNRNIYNMAKAEGIKQGKAEGIDKCIEMLEHDCFLSGTASKVLIHHLEQLKEQK